MTTRRLSFLSSSQVYLCEKTTLPAGSLAVIVDGHSSRMAATPLIPPGLRVNDGVAGLPSKYTVTGEVVLLMMSTLPSSSHWNATHNVARNTNGIAPGQSFNMTAL